MTGDHNLESIMIRTTYEKEIMDLSLNSKQAAVVQGDQEQILGNTVMI